MTMNPFEQSKRQLLHFLTSQAEREVVDYIRQEMQQEMPDSVPAKDELLTFFRSPDAPEISLRTLCDLIRYQQLKEFGIVHSAKEFIQLFHPNEQEDTP